MQFFNSGDTEVSHKTIEMMIYILKTFVMM